MKKLVIASLLLFAAYSSNAQKTWYSYQSGNWTAPSSWTLDGSVFPLLVNPSNEIPTAVDNVVITTGRIISMNVNNAQVTSMEVIGTLDLLAFTGHNFTTISGAGRIKMSGAVDNFPLGTTTSFADAVIGGTLEINGAGTISLNQNRTLRNLEINLTGIGDIASLESNYTLNGDFTITNGLFRFNNTTTANRTFTVNGHTTITSAGGIRVGISAALTRHEFNLHGDFTNNGTAFFSQRVDDSQRNAAEATNGIVDVNMISPSRDQRIVCNGVTRFYRIEIAKGTDDTYKATISASAPANFGLFGKMDYDIDTPTGNNLNALGLNVGTVEIGTNINIPYLNTLGNFAIYQGAQLWINGGSATKSGGTAIVPYGRLKVSAGTLLAPIGSGITTRQNGIIEVTGGTLTAQQIRTSVAGVSAVGSYIQSGGVVTLTGGAGISADYAVFSLTYTGNVFNMSGGTLLVQNRPTLGTGNLRGSIFINSDPANVSVTGGTVILESNNAVVYRVTSRAAFWNVIFRGTGGVRSLQLLGTTSGQGTAGVDELTLPIQPLTVLNDLTIENNATFATNNADVTITHNLSIQNGGIYTSGLNTTTLTGSGTSSLIFGNTTTTQNFNNLVINKSISTDQVVITSGRPSTNFAIQVDGNFSVSSGIFDYGAFLVSAKSTVNLGSGVAVGTSTSSGKLVLNGTTDQTLNSSNANLYNIEFNNTDPTPVITLGTGGLNILRTFTMTSGLFDIGTYKLTMQGASAAISGTFGPTRMIQTAGNSSDGGLAMYLDANEVLTFPFGVAGKYTPAVANFASFSDDGLVNIIPVNSLLQTTNLGGGANYLHYYWRVGYSNFTTLPTVSYQFTYSDSDLNSGDGNFRPGKVLDVLPFTRSLDGATNDVDPATNIITFNGTSTGGTFPGARFALELANYTAGQTNRFNGGSPEIYYTKRGGDGFTLKWNNAANWTLATNGALNPHDSNQPDAPDFPQVGDIAVVGFVPFNDAVVARRGEPHGIAIDGITADIAELRFTQLKDISNNPTARVYAYNFQFRPTVVLNNPGTPGQLTNARVSGEGMFWIRSDGGNLSDPNFAGVDLGAFNLEDSAYVIYENTINGANYVNLPSAFPNLMMATDGWGSANKNTTISKDITVNGDFELLGNINMLLPTGAVGNITINRNLRFFQSSRGANSGDGGELRFGNTGTPRTITVGGNVILGNGYSGSGFVIRIDNPDGTPITHTFNLYGSLIQNTTGSNNDIAPNGNGFKAGNNAANDRIHLNLLGANSMVLTNTAGDAPQFYSVTVNKGSSIATTASFNSNFTIDGPTNLATKSLVLQNGLFIINNALANVVLTSGGGDFNIPASAGLEVRAGTARTTTISANASLTLDGLLRISGPTAIVDINGGGATDTNFIEYSNSGNAAIEITNGALTVAGQIRRQNSSATGTLRYTQSGGTVLVGNESATIVNRGVFEVLNPGSQFNHSGGSLTVVRGINSTTIPSLWLEPGTSNITSGSTITIGNGSTPAGVNSQNIGIQSTVALNNLTIAGSNSPIAKIYISPLTVNGNLLVSAASTLNANSEDLTIGGDFTVNGTYVPTTNTTTFTNTAGALISGTTATFSFYNFTKTGLGLLTIGKDITINRDMSISDGTLATGAFMINLKRHALVNSTITSTINQGLIFNGAVQQQLTRSSTGTGTLGIVTINNALGVVIPDATGYNFNITTGLRLQQGVFDIGGSLLFLRINALITPVNPYSATNMIQTNSSFTDKGVRKEFPLNYSTNFTFPVGQMAYTPVIFNLSTPGNTTGTSGTPTITVRPANERHPSIINDNGPGELPSPAAFNDLNNVLQYYWIVNADNVANTFRSTMTMLYPQSAVSVVAPYTEASYIAARILSDLNPSKLINKFTTTEVDETTNIITFNFTGVTDAGISADYFAGVNVAIPDNVPIYTTTASGNVDAAIYTPVVPGGGAPTGATVIVLAGHNLNFNINNINLYETQINAGATVTIPHGSNGHRLGIVTGTGDLRINSDNSSMALPAAVYDDFFSCSGGGLIFGGNGGYTIMAGVFTVRNLTLFGPGTKLFASNDVTVCNDLTLNPTGRLNTNNKVLTVQNDLIVAGGEFNHNSSGGTLSVTRDLIVSSGTFNGGGGGVKTIGRNLVVSGGTFDSGSGSTNITQVNGNMTVANAATFNSGTGGVTGQRFRFGGSTVQTLTGTFTVAKAFNRLEINNNSGFGLLLVGDATINSELLLTNGHISPGNNTLLMEANAVSNPTEGKITSFVNGKLYRVFASAGDSFTFPIGLRAVAGNYWATGAVKNVSAAGTWDMEFIGQNADANETVVTNMIPVAPIQRIASGGYWVVTDGTVSASGKTATIGLSWGLESDVSPVFAERQALQVVQWEPGTSQWSNKGGANFSGGHTNSRGTFDATSTTSFSRRIVTLGSSVVANPLPVSFLAFIGKTENGINVLRWSTASEKDNDYFELERSTNNAETFEVIGRVNGNGTTRSLLWYTFADYGARVGKNYYRLKQVDYDGTISYHPDLVLITLEQGTEFLDFTVSPNPTRDQQLNLQVFKSNDDAVQIRLYDVNGKVCLTHFDTMSSLELKTTQLTPGIYIVEITQGFRRITKRVVIKD